MLADVAGRIPVHAQDGSEWCSAPLQQQVPRPPDQPPPGPLGEHADRHGITVGIASSAPHRPDQHHVLVVPLQRSLRNRDPAPEALRAAPVAARPRPPVHLPVRRRSPGARGRAPRPSPARRGRPHRASGVHPEPARPRGHHDVRQPAARRGPGGEVQVCELTGRGRTRTPRGTWQARSRSSSAATSGSSSTSGCCARPASWPAA
jgi:hypothetical protein